MDNPSAQDLIDIGISRGHAYDILGDRQSPSLTLAFKIYDATGGKFGLLKDLPVDTIEHLRPKATDQDKAA